MKRTTSIRAVESGAAEIGKKPSTTPSRTDQNNQPWPSSAATPAGGYAGTAATTSNTESPAIASGATGDTIGAAAATTAIPDQTRKREPASSIATAGRSTGRRMKRRVSNSGEAATSKFRSRAPGATAAAHQGRGQSKRLADTNGTSRYTAVSAAAARNGQTGQRPMSQPSIVTALTTSTANASNSIASQSTAATSGSNSQPVLRDIRRIDRHHAGCSSCTSYTVGG
jgi:hypothetical protein